MIFLFENFAESRLEGGAAQSDSVLHIPAQDAAKFPNPATPQQRFALILYDGIQAPEVVWAKTNPGTGAIEVERGQEGSAATAWRPGTAVINAPTKVSLNYLASGGADSWHQELVDMVNEAYARITVLNELVLTENYAMATRIENVEAGWGENNAQVQTLARAFASVSEAWATYQVEVNAQSAEATARATQALNASTNAERAVAELETNIEAALGEDFAAFADKIQSLVDFDAAQVSRNTTYEAKMEDNRAAIAQEVLVRATQYDAQTAINTEHNSRIAGNTGRIETEEQTRASETSALAQRSSNLEAEVTAGRGGAANLAARISGVESAAASATAAVATRTSTLEARRESFMNLLQKSRSTNTSTAVTWGTAPYGFLINGNGVTQERSFRVGPLEQGVAYSLRFRAKINKPAGETQTVSVDLHPDTLPEVVFTIQGGDPQEYVWEGITSSHPDMLLETVRLRFFRNIPVGTSLELTDMVFVRSSVAPIGWMPPPQESGYDDTAVRALITSEETARVSADSALASRASTLEAQMGGTQTSNLRARIESEESARASADSALASRATTLEAKMEGTQTSGLRARVESEEQARVAGDSALASRIATVESLTNVGANLLPNSTFLAGMTNWNTSVWYPSNLTAAFGTHAFSSANGTNNLTSDPIVVNSSNTYTISADARRLAAGGNLCLDFQWLDSGGNHLGYSTRIIYNTNQNFGEQPRKWATASPPSGATQAKVRVYGEGITGVQTNGLAVRQIKVEVGASPTIWTDERSDSIITANVTQTMQTLANAGNLDAWWQVQAIAGSALAGIRAKANSAGGSQIGMIADAIALFNNVMGQAEEVLVAQSGNVYIRKKLILGPLGELEFDPAYPAIFWKIGSTTLAIGKLPQNNLLFWFGPTQTPANMRKSNSTIWFDTSGAAYWGGQIIAGTISNTGYGTLTGVPANFSLGPFATNGNPIAVVWSYDYVRQGYRWGDQTGTISGSTSATLRLYRKIGGGAETLVDSMTVSGNINATYDPEPWPGQPAGTTGRTTFSEFMGASKTYTDTAGGTGQRTFRVEVVSRSQRSVGGTSGDADGITQRYGMTTSES